MSGLGPVPSRLEELRRDFHQAALDAPNVSVVVVHRPASRLNHADGRSIDTSDPFFRGFLRREGDPVASTASAQVIGLKPIVTSQSQDELAAIVTCQTVTTPPYFGRVTNAGGDEVDWEGMVRGCWATDPQASRPYWQAWVHFFGATQHARWDMLATDAATLLLGDNARTPTPVLNWSIHVAENTTALCSSTLRSVIIPSPSPRRTTHQQVIFLECPTESRWSATKSRLPSWWVVILNNAFRLSRDAIDLTLAAGKQEGNRARGDIQWSVPQTIQQWAKVFNLGRNAMSKRLNSGEISSRKVGLLWMVAVTELPRTHREKLSKPT
jgi:hypothetical protein